MVGGEAVLEIRVLHRHGKGIREIARAMGSSRNERIELCRPRRTWLVPRRRFVSQIAPHRTRTMWSALIRTRTDQMQIGTRSELEPLSCALLEPLFPVARGIRLLGISLSFPRA